MQSTSFDVIMVRPSLSFADLRPRASFRCTRVGVEGEAAKGEGVKRRVGVDGEGVPREGDADAAWVGRWVGGSMGGR